MHVNLPRRALAAGRSPRDWSFVRQVLEGREPMVVPDVQQHPVFAQSGVPAGRHAARLRGRAAWSPRAAASTARCACSISSRWRSTRARSTRSPRSAGASRSSCDGGLERADSQERFTALSRLALTDPVTGLANRRGGEEALAREVARARRSGIAAQPRAVRHRSLQAHQRPGGPRGRRSRAARDLRHPLGVAARIGPGDAMGRRRVPRAAARRRPHRRAHLRRARARERAEPGRSARRGASRCRRASPN